MGGFCFFRSRVSGRQYLLWGGVSVLLPFYPDPLIRRRLLPGSDSEVVLSILLLLNVSPTENPINNTHYSGSSKDPLPWIVLRHEVAVK